VWLFHFIRSGLDLQKCSMDVLTFVQSWAILVADRGSKNALAGNIKVSHSPPTVEVWRVFVFLIVPGEPEGGRRWVSVMGCGSYGLASGLR
jgi:hypothetical protein